MIGEIYGNILMNEPKYPTVKLIKKINHYNLWYINKVCEEISTFYKENYKSDKDSNKDK